MKTGFRNRPRFNLTFTGRCRILPLLIFILTTLIPSLEAQLVVIPDPGLNAAVREELQKPTGPLSQSDLLVLTELIAKAKGISSLEGLGAAHNLTYLELSFNLLTNLDMPAGLTNLTWLLLEYNGLTNIVFPSGMSQIRSLSLRRNLLSSFRLPSELASLQVLELVHNTLTNFSCSSGLTNLYWLWIDENQLESLDLPSDLTSLTKLYARNNRLRDFLFLSGLTNLQELSLGGNQLTNAAFPAALSNLTYVDVSSNQIAGLSFTGGLPDLRTLLLSWNQLTNLTLPPGFTSLINIDLTGNPLTTFVLDQSLAAGSLAGTVASLRSNGVSVYTYPLEVRLTSPRFEDIGAFGFTLNGPPAAYMIISSLDLTNWIELKPVTNLLGSVPFVDVEATNFSRRFYRAKSLPQ